MSSPPPPEFYWAVMGIGGIIGAYGLYCVYCLISYAREPSMPD